MALLEIGIAGSPYELGCQHGQQARELIRLCFQQFCRFGGIDDRAEKERLAALIENNVAVDLSEF